MQAEGYTLPVQIEGQLRSYQKAGINWLGFLRRCGLHGVLADDMGLGKTLQTSAIVAGAHTKHQAHPTLGGAWGTLRVQMPAPPKSQAALAARRMQPSHALGTTSCTTVACPPAEGACMRLGPPHQLHHGLVSRVVACAAAHVEARAQGLPHRPSLVVCPSTLVPHWPHEMARFVSSAALTTVQYEGLPGTRRQLQVRPHACLTVPSRTQCCAAIRSTRRSHARECMLGLVALLASCHVLLVACCGVMTVEQSGARAGHVQAAAAQADVVVMSYETLRSDADWASSLTWLYCVLDEGHMIRNPKSKLAQVGALSACLPVLFKST